MARTKAASGTFQAQPLWARVDANRTKLTLFVALFLSGSVVLLTAALVATPGALIGLATAGPGSRYWFYYSMVVAGSAAVLLLIGCALSAVQLANAEDWVRNRFLGRPLEEGDAPQLAQVVADMSIAAGLRQPPALLVLEVDTENAFAIGTLRSRATIGVTRGMLERFSPDELRAVVAVLTARIVAGDIMFGTALAALMGPIRAVRESRKVLGAATTGSADVGCGDPGCSGCADIGNGCVDIGDLDDWGCGGFIAAAVFVALVAAITYIAVVIAAWIVTAWGRALNRASYEKADAEGMLLLKDPAPMISALRKAIKASTEVADKDQSYDGIFYTQTSGTPRVEKAERRRFKRLCEVIGVDGLAAEIDDGVPAQ